MEKTHKMLIERDLSKTFDRSKALARLAADDAAVVRMLAASAVPEVCGPDIPVAPARGGFRVLRLVEIVPGSSGTARPAGHRGPGEATFRAPIKAVDVFDRMEQEAKRAHARHHPDGAGYVAPFSAGQVETARGYRALVECRNAGGIRCASLEAGRGGGAGGEFIDAFVADGIALKALEMGIGVGVALTVRRIRPSARGTMARGIIHDRTLVDSVCLGDKSVTQVLKAHGWAVKGETREALRKALAGALDRMWDSAARVRAK